jgi:hypothetical protein
MTQEALHGLYWWRRKSRGGYGFIEHIPVRLLGKGQSRWQVEALLADGSVKKVSVPPKNLIPMLDEAINYLDKFPY